ncbi:hypothetical protein DRV85_02710 [Rhodosalinus halophilus]|uniref:NADH dehydrogenase n=2 Tax=Rhodosalinus halophilus TaxID=2259333 RepID=A0A365UD24_9RHOB|nr:hypothetical protein DRV85_02710 [Rhodosalinus halophilus]
MNGGGGGLLWLVIVGVLVVIPFWKLLPRFGIPSWVALAALIPFGALVLLWVMAFKDDGGRA